MANSEVLKLSLLLQLKDDASAGLSGFTRHLQKLDSQGKLTLATLAKIRKELSRGGMSNFDRAAVASLKRIDAQSIKTVKGLDRVRAKLNQQAKMPFRVDGVQRDPGVILTRGRRPRDPFANPPGTVERIGDFHDRYIEPGMQAGRTLRRGLGETADMVRPSVDSAMKVARAESQFRLMNLSPEENARAFAAVNKQVRQLGITTKSEALANFTDLHNVIGNVNGALAALPEASKYGFSMRALFGSSPEEVQTQIQNSFKYLELTGQTSQEEMKRGFDRITQIAAATGGRLTGADFLAMGKTAGVSGRDLTTEGMLQLSTLMQEMGSSRTGTSFMTAYRAIVGGKMQQSAMERFADFGMVDESKVEWGKAQKMKSLKPGAIRGSDKFQRDPLAFFDMLRDAMQAKGVKFEYDEQGNLTDESARTVNRELGTLFTDRRGFDLASSMMTLRGNVEKEARLAANAKGIEGMFKEAMEGPAGKVERWNVALERLKEESGGPILEVLAKLAGAMQPVISLAGQFPMVAAGGLGLVALGKGVTTVTEAFSIFNSTNPRSLALLNQTRDGVVDVASAMTSNRTRVSGFARELDGLGLKAGRTDRAIGGLRSSMRSLSSSPAVKMGVTLGAVAVAAGVTEFLIDQIQQDLDRKAKNAELKVNLTGLVDEIFITGEAGKNTTRTAEAHQNFFTQLEDNGQLAKALHPDRNTWSDLVMGWLTLPTATFNNPFAAIGNYANPTRHQYGTNYSGYGILSPRLTGQTSDTTAQAIAAIMATNKNLAQAVRDPKEAASILGKMPQWAEGAGLNRDLPMLNAAIKQLIVANAGGGKQGEEKWSLILDIMKDRGLATPILSMTAPPASSEPSTLGSFKPWERPFSFMPPESKSFDLNRPGQLGAHQPFYSKPVRPFETITERRPSLMADAKPKQLYGDIKPFELKPQSLTSLFDVGKSKDALNQFATPVQTNTTHLQNLSGPLAMNVTSFTDLQPRTGNTAQAFADLIDPANRVPPSFRTVGTSALALAIALDGVAAKVAGFQMPPIPGGPPLTGGRGGPVKNLGIAKGHAIGGTVLSDGLVSVHRGNVITPARTTDGLRGFDQLMNLARSSRPRDSVFSRESISQMVSTMSVKTASEVLKSISQKESSVTSFVNSPMARRRQGSYGNSWSVPGRAVGGIVERDGMAFVHEGNVITPAKVTRGLEGYGDLMAFVRSVKRDSPRENILGPSQLHGRQGSYQPSVTNLINVHPGREDSQRYPEISKLVQFARRPDLDGPGEFRRPVSEFGRGPMPTLQPELLQRSESNAQPMTINVPITVQINGKTSQETEAKLDRALNNLPKRIVKVVAEALADERKRA